jgi:hypothetical protein
MNAEDLGYVEELLGLWEVQYPGADGMLVEDYAERLELKVDGTFSWEPTPLWAKPDGRWGISINGDTGEMRLCIEERSKDRYRVHWLVLVTLPVGAHSALIWHWQRTRADAVVFADRILVARQYRK